MSTSAFLTILIIKQAAPQVQQPFVPALIIAAIGYIVGSLFLSIFSFSCTAILQCFIMDEDMGGSVNSPQSLQSFLDHNDAMNKKKEDNKKDDKPTGGTEDAPANNVS